MTSSGSRDVAQYPSLPRALRWVADNPARTAVLVSIGLMVYQAALPHGLTLDPSARTFEWRLLPSGDYSVSRADIVGNVVPYWLFGHFVVAAWWRRGSSLARSCWAGLLGAFLMALTVEGIQLFNPDRGSAMWDLVSGFIGGIGAVVSGGVYCRLIADRLSAWLVRDAAERPVQLAAALTGGFILLDAAKPFYLISSANLLWDNIKRSNLIPFRPPGDDIRDQLQLAIFGHDPQPLAPLERTLDYWASQYEFFALASLLLALFIAGRRGGGLRGPFLIWMVVLLSALGLRLIIVDSRTDITYLVVALMGAPLAVWAARRAQRRPIAGLVGAILLCSSYVLATDLRPFELGPARPVTLDTFIPLIHQFRDIRVTQLWGLVEATLVYVPIGAALYALKLNRVGPARLTQWPSAWPAALYCGALALVVESVQLWMPARVSHIDDVLLAMLGGVVGASLLRLILAGRPIVARS